MLVDSQLERQTLDLLIECRNWLSKNHGISVTIEKPMFDLGSVKTDDAREVCRPDFVLRCHRRNGTHVIVIVETMGFNDPVYRERKHRMRVLFEQIKGGIPPHAVIEYDIFNRNMSPKAVDLQFRDNVCSVIIEKCSRAG